MLSRIRHGLFKPHSDLGSLLLRLGLGIIFTLHGYLKLMQGGGRQWDPGLPELQQLAVAWGEVLCGAALLLGLLSRLAAIGLGAIMVGAIVIQTGKFEFIYTSAAYVKDPSRLPTGSEYNFALIMMCLAVVALGSGKFSLDHLIFGRMRKEAAPPTTAT